VKRNQLIEISASTNDTSCSNLDLTWSVTTDQLPDCFAGVIVQNPSLRSPMFSLSLVSDAPDGLNCEIATYSDPNCHDIDLDFFPLSQLSDVGCVSNLSEDSFLSFEIKC